MIDLYAVTPESFSVIATPDRKLFHSKLRYACLCNSCFGVQAPCLMFDHAVLGLQQWHVLFEHHFDV